MVTKTVKAISQQSAITTKKPQPMLWSLVNMSSLCVFVL